MIFVALGTQKQSMNRLLEYLKDRKETIVVQNGHTSSKGYPYQFLNFVSYEEMEKWICQADVVLTHGGGGTVFLALHHHKKVIIVPRRKKYKEHINDHQVEFSNYLKKKGYVLVVNTKEELEHALDHIQEMSFVPYLEEGQKEYQKEVNQIISNLLEKEK